VGMGYLCFIPLSGVFGAKKKLFFFFFFTSTHFFEWKIKRIDNADLILQRFLIIGGANKVCVCEKKHTVD